MSFLERLKNVKSKLRLGALCALAATFTCCVVLAFAAIFGGDVFRNADADAAGNEINLGVDGITSDNAEEVQKMFTLINKNASKYTDLATYVPKNGVQGGMFAGNYVTLGGLQWNIVFISKDTSGDVVATLWLANSAGMSRFGNNADYSISVAREAALALKGSDGTAVLDSYGDYLDAPSEIAWQKDIDVILPGIGIAEYPGYKLPNEFWGMSTDELDSDLKNVHHSAWKEDKLWLPSVSEIGYYQNIWSIEQGQRADSKNIGTYYWTRSGYVGSYRAVYCGMAYGQVDSSTNPQIPNFVAVDQQYVRPALHLNLRLAAEAAGLPTGVTVADLGVSGINKDTASGLKTLFTAINGKDEYNELKSIYDQMNYPNGMSSSYLSNLKVILGGLRWDVMYVSKDTDGELVATLWLETSVTKAAYDNTAGANYYSGPLRAAALDFKGKDGNSLLAGYGSYLDTPSQIPWQISAEGFTGYEVNYDKPNDYFNAPADEMSSAVRSNHSAEWQSDRIWIPSYTEVYYSNSESPVYRGIFQTEAKDRVNLIDTWLRSSYELEKNKAYMLDGFTGECTYALASNTFYAVRPAIHLNLKAAAEAAGLVKTANNIDLGVNGITESSAPGLKTLFNAINGKNNYKTMSEAFTTNIKATAFTDYRVTLGGLEWYIVYASKDTSGDVVATLWLTSGKNTGAHSTATNNAVYCGSTLHTTAVNYRATDNTYIGTTYGAVLDTPSQMKWQQMYQNLTSDDGIELPYTSVYPNEFLSVNAGTTGSNHSAAWQSDRIWIPSVGEVGGNAPYVDIWGLSQSQRANSTYTWLRSSDQGTINRAWAIRPDGSAVQSANAQYPYGVRPALHLNLRLAADAAGLSTNVKNIDLGTEGITSANKSGFVNLFGAISGDDTTYDGMKKSFTDNIKATAFTEYTVTLAGLKWEIAYVSKDVNGDIVATLLLQSPTLISKYNTSGFARYGQCYISQQLAEYKGSNNMRIDLTYGQVLDTPAQMPWQRDCSYLTSADYTGNIKVNNKFPNEFWGTEDTSLMNDQVLQNQNDNWKGDSIWLPSVSELGLESDASSKIDIWGLSDSQKKISNNLLYWLRSGSYEAVGSAVAYNGNNPRLLDVGADGIYVRPAIHLNLKKAAQKAGFDVREYLESAPEAAENVNYSGEAQELLTGYDPAKMVVYYTYTPWVSGVGVDAVTTKTRISSVAFTDAGTYTFEIFPNGGYCWSDGSESAVTVTSYIYKHAIVTTWGYYIAEWGTPEYLTYNGVVQTLGMAIVDAASSDPDAPNVSIKPGTLGSQTYTMLDPYFTYDGLTATNAGEYTAHIKLKGVYANNFYMMQTVISDWGTTSYENCAKDSTGASEKYREYTVEKLDISTAAAGLTATIADQTYSGSALTPVPTVKFKTSAMTSAVTLTKGTSTSAGNSYYYTTAGYRNNTNAAMSTATNAPSLTINGAGNFTGQYVIKFNINKANLYVDLSYGAVTYGTNSAAPTLTIKRGSSTGTAISAPATPSYSVSKSSTVASTTGYPGKATVASTGIISPTGAGKIEITVTIAASTNYNSGTKSVEVTIGKAQVNSVTWGTTSKTYNGSALTASVTAFGTANTFNAVTKPTVANLFTVSGSITTVGTAKATATLKDTTNYEYSTTVANSTRDSATTVSKTLTVSAATITATVNNVEKTYTGKEFVIAKTGTSVTSAQTLVGLSATTVNSQAYTYKFSTTITNGASGDWTSAATSYNITNANASAVTVYYQITAANHNAKYGSFTVKVNNADFSTFTVTGYTGTYDGASHNAATYNVVAVGSGNTITYKWGTSESALSATMPTVTNYTAGTTIYYSISAPNHNTKTGSVTAKVNKANLYIDLSYGAVTYGTTSAAPTLTIKRGSSTGTAISAPATPSYSVSKSSTVASTTGYPGKATVAATGIISPTGAGKIEITVTIAASTNYNSGTKSVEVTIGKAQVNSVTWGTTSKTYNGSALTASVTAFGTANTFNAVTKPTVANLFTVSGSITTVGTAKATATLKDTTNYEYSTTVANSTRDSATTVSKTLTVSAATITATVNNVEKTYTGKEFVIAKAGTSVTSAQTLVGLSATTVNSQAYTYKFSTTITNGASGNWTSAATSYKITNANASAVTVYYQITAANHNAKYGSFTVKVNNADFSTFTVTGYTGTYDGASHNAATYNVVAVGSGNTITYKWGTSASALSTTMPTVTNYTAGTTIYYSISAPNHNTKTGSVTAKVNKAVVTGVTWDNPAGGYTYDGTTHQPKITLVKTANTLASGALPASYDDMFTYAGGGVDNGNYTATATLKDDYAKNFTFSENKTSTSVEFVIIAAGIEIEGLMSATYVTIYDGGNHGIFTDLKAGPTVKLGSTTGAEVKWSYRLDEASAWKSVEDWKGIPSYSDAGSYTVYFMAQADGYDDYTGSVAIAIKKATLTVSSAITGKSYDGKTDGKGSITLTGAVNGEKPEATGTFAWTAATAGTAKYDVTGIALTGDWDKNYALNVTELKAQSNSGVSISKVTLTVSSAITGKSYDGKTDGKGSITLTGAVNGEKPEATGTFAWTAATAGTKTYDVTGIALTGDWDKNYALNVTELKAQSNSGASISKVTLTVSSAITGKAYDGKTDGKGSITLTGAVNGEKPEATGTFAWTAATAGTKTYDVTGIALTGEWDTNYALNVTELKAQSNDGVSVQKAKLTADVTVSDKTYDGGKTATVTVDKLNGIIGEDDVTATATGAFENANAGEDKTVTVTYVLAGDAADNYTIEGSTATATVKKAALTADVTVSDKTYDGGKTATVTVDKLNGIIGGDDVTATAAGAFESADAGEDKTVTVTYVLAGAAADNYSIESSTATATVTAKTLTIKWGETTSWTYDGNSHKPTATLDGFVSGESAASVTVSGEQINASDGEYTATVTGWTAGANTTADNYVLPEEKSVKFSITPKDIATDGVLTVTGEYSYTGEALTPAYTVTNGGKALEKDVDYTVTLTDNVNAGTATLTLTGKGNYSASSTIETTFTIKKAVITGVTWDNPETGYPYDGLTHQPKITKVETLATEALPVNYDEMFTYTGGAINQGEGNTATATLKDEYAKNFTFADDKTSTETTFIIAAAAIKIEGLVGDTFVTAYDGNDHGIFSDLVNGPTLLFGDGSSDVKPEVSWFYRLDEDVEWTAATNGWQDLPKYKGVGSRTVYYKASAENYSDNTGSVTITINKAVITADVTVSDKTYDGGKIATVTVGTLNGYISGDDLTVTATGEFGSADAGENKSVSVTYTLSGAAAGNYSIENSTATATINKAELTADVTVSEKTYDGGKTATVTVDNLNGIIGGDDVTATATGAFESADAGKDKTVTITYTLSGTAAGNYFIESSTSTAEITPKDISTDGELTVTGEYSYTGEALTPAYTVTNDGKALAEDVDYTVTLTDNVNAGTATLTLTGKGNYSANSVLTATFEIGKAKLTDITENVTVTYDGKAHGLTVAATGFKGTDTFADVATVSFGTESGSENADSLTQKDKGQLTVYYVATFANYETISGNKTITVNAREITVEWTGTSFDYDGKAHLPDATLKGLAGGEEYLLSGITVGEAKQITLSNGDVLNVTVALVSGGTSDMTSEGSYSLSISADNPNYVINEATRTVTVTIKPEATDNNQDGGLSTTAVALITTGSVVAAAAGAAGLAVVLRKMVLKKARAKADVAEDKSFEDGDGFNDDVDD